MKIGNDGVRWKEMTVTHMLLPMMFSSLSGKKGSDSLFRPCIAVYHILALCAQPSGQRSSA